MAENTNEAKNQDAKTAGTGKIEVKGVAEEKINAKNPKKEKRITAEELIAKARHMQEISDDQDIIRRIEQTAAKFSEVNVEDLLKGIQEIVDSDNEEAQKKEEGKEQKPEDDATDTTVK